MKYRILALLLAGMMLTACASASGQAAQTSSNVRTSATAMTTTAPISTVEATETTSAPVITVETPVTTTAPITTETPVTEAPETTAPSTMTQEPITTETPITTEAPVTSTDTPVTDVPITTTEPPIGTTETPVTTTTAPITTTEATVTTTAPPVTEAPVVHTHSYSAWKTTKEATCTANGTKTRTCACGESQTEAISATGHSYGSWKTTKAATCTATGTKTKTCANCGDKKTETIAKTDHSYGEWKTTKAATCSATGTKTKTCATCGDKKTESIAKTDHSFGEWILCDDYINEIRYCACGETETQVHAANPETDEQLVADRVIYYINKYRAEEGKPTAAALPKLSLMAQMRSTQLVGLTASSDYYEWHDTDDLRECAAYYQYGEYFDPTEWGMEGDPYYRAPVGEAVGHNYWYPSDTIDAAAKRIADQFRASEGHWRYVGGSSPYIAVGITYSKGKSYTAIFTCSTTQYE